MRTHLWQISLLCRENTGDFLNFEGCLAVFPAHIAQKYWRSRVNSLKEITGNFFRPNREINFAIRELYQAIRERLNDRVVGSNRGPALFKLVPI